MAAPRTPLFQRKGPLSGDPTSGGKPSVVIAIGHGGPKPGGEQPTGPDDSSSGDGDTVQCQSCGATINCADGSVMSPPDDGGSGSQPPGPPLDAGGSPPPMMGAA